MAKKRKQSETETEQLSLFDLNQATENSADNYIEAKTDDYDEFDPEDIGYDELGFTE